MSARTSGQKRTKSQTESGDGKDAAPSSSDRATDPRPAKRGKGQKRSNAMEDEPADGDEPEFEDQFDEETDPADQVIQDLIQEKHADDMNVDGGTGAGASSSASAGEADDDEEPDKSITLGPIDDDGDDNEGDDEGDDDEDDVTVMGGGALANA